MRRLVVVLLVTLAALLAGPSALAAPPTHQTEPVDIVFVDAEACGFPVETHVTGFAVHIEWANEDGSVRLFEADPQLKATLTNLSSGESITVNISGPAHISENPDGSATVVGTGLWIHGGNPQTGAPGIFLSAGRFVLSVDAEGNQSLQFVGQVTDLCAELAA